MWYNNSCDTILVVMAADFCFPLFSYIIPAFQKLSFWAKNRYQQQRDPLYQYSVATYCLLITVFLLRGYMNNYRRAIGGYRQIWATLQRMYGEKCVYCHSAISTQIDHVIPYSYSRYHGLENLRPCCAWCNLLASDTVFEDFEQKYDFLKQKRASKRRNPNAMLDCTNCLIPYYSALHSNAFLCPRCYAFEYQASTKHNRGWHKWLETMAAAGIDYKAYFHLGDVARRHLEMPRGDKIEYLVAFLNKNKSAAWINNYWLDTQAECSDILPG